MADVKPMRLSWIEGNITFRRVDWRWLPYARGERGGTLAVGWLCFHIEAVWC